MMHLRILYPLFLLAFLLSLVAAAPDDAFLPKPKPKPSPTPTQTPKPAPTASCSKELLCCLQAASPIVLSAKLILDLLHINLTPEQKGKSVGLTCSTLHKGGIGDFCFLKPLCCDKSYQSGIIAIGCDTVKL